jgi:hypothetical protein
MPELGPEARRAIDRHLDSVGDHLVAVMWEMAFAIVRSSEQRAEAARAAGVDNLVERLRSEAQRIADDLTRLRERSSAAVEAVGAPPPAPGPSSPAPPATEVEQPAPAREDATTWTPTDGLAPEQIEDEPDEGSEPAELPKPEPEPEPGAEEPEPAQPSSRGRRASMHDNPVWSLFHRTEEPEATEVEAEPEPPPQPEAKPEAPGNRKLMELARAVELAGAPPPPEDEDEDA